jgi:LL-diaminopimelate aminotransferase
MIKVNPHYSKLKASYLFVNIAKKVKEFTKANPDKSVIKLGIGDVTLPLSKTVITAFHKGVDEMAADGSFKGYGPEKGYSFLREAVAQGDFASRGIEIDPEDIFVSDGSKCDTGNFQELFDGDITIAIPDPVYPVYVDTNVMAGRTGEAIEGRYEGLVYLEGNEENGFVPGTPAEKVDLIYLCFPNNPTGATASKEQLQVWVDYAKANQALILFDAAYAAFISDPDIPRSIYEIPGAKEVAVEFRSFSKTAGFTGTRCAYTVIPKECRVYDDRGEAVPLKPLWNRRHSTKFNGVSYPVQVAAASVYSPEGQAETKALVGYYMENARLIREKMEVLGYKVTGGKNSPYIWVYSGLDSWEIFDKLLNEAAVVTTPGSGFGKAGEGYIRISAFNHREKVLEALERIEKALK